MQKKNFGRQQRVASEIKKVLSEFLLSNPFVDEKINSAFVSITDVVVSACLQHARVYVTSLSKDFLGSECLEFLNKHSPQLRKCIASKIRLKFVPEVIFVLDQSFDITKRIEHLLQAE